MTKYIYDRPHWPRFTWDARQTAQPLSDVHVRQGRLLGQLAALGFSRQNEALLQALTDEVVKSSEIEGETLAPDQVRSSIARRLGIDVGGLVPADRRVEGVVTMTLEATRNYAQPLSAERLFTWHKDLLAGAPPRINLGTWRDDAHGPMQVVSGPIGRERVHYEAPPAGRIEAEMRAFFDWANDDGGMDPVLRAAQAHLWFVTIHPFDDGNGRIARAITEWALARAEKDSRRFYSMSAQIRLERKDYYQVLERTQKGGLDVTEWMLWFLACLDRAITQSEASLTSVLAKDRFWKTHAARPLNDRQRRVLNLLLEGTFEGKLTSTKWSKLTKCSQDTAHRDLIELVEHGILTKGPAGGRSTSYDLVR